MSTLQDIQNEIAKLQAQAESIRNNEINAAVADIKSKIALYGITAEQLGFHGTRAAKAERIRKPAEVKYRHPQNAELTWTGRGREPKWVSAWLGEDKKRKVEDLLINKPATAPVAASKAEGAAMEPSKKTITLPAKEEKKEEPQVEKRGFFGR